VRDLNSVINELNSNSEFRQVKDQLVREAATSRDVYFSEDGNVPLDESAIIKRIELNSNFFNSSLEDIVWKGEGLLDFRDRFPLADPSSKSSAGSGAGGKERTAADKNDVNLEHQKCMSELNLANAKAAQAKAYADQAELLERLDAIAYKVLRKGTREADRLRRDESLSTLERALKQRKFRAKQDKVKKD